MNQSYLSVYASLFVLIGLIISCTNVRLVQSKEKTTAAVQFEKSAVSGIQVPGAGNVPAPSGTGCNLQILNWAGFDGAASYTFDDGQPSHVSHWKELKATGVPMTFYLVPGMVSSAAYENVWKDMLASGCELGNHTGTHKKLSDYKDDDAIVQDIEKCSAYLARLGQPDTCSFAYPFGQTGWKDSFNGKFLLARSVNNGAVKPLDNTDPLVLPVFAVNGTHTEKSFNDALDSSVKGKSWLIFMYHSILPGENWYAGVSVDSIVGSINHAKSDGRLWLDTVERIGAYWLAQKMFSTLEPADDSVAKTWTWTLPEHFTANMYLRVKVDGGILSQKGVDLPWNSHGFYEVALDAGILEWRQ